MLAGNEKLDYYKTELHLLQVNLFYVKEETLYDWDTLSYQFFIKNNLLEQENLKAKINKITTKSPNTPLQKQVESILYALRNFELNEFSAYLNDMYLSTTKPSLRSSLILFRARLSILSLNENLKLINAKEKVAKRQQLSQTALELIEEFHVFQKEQRKKIKLKKAKSMVRKWELANVA